MKLTTASPTVFPRLILCLGAVLLLIGRPALAVDAEGNFSVLSMGTRPCSRYVEAYAGNGWDKLMHSAWVGGYLTAVNEYVSDRRNVSSSMMTASRDRWLLDYCQREPDATLGEAAAALLVVLQAGGR